MDLSTSGASLTAESEALRNDPNNGHWWACAARLPEHHKERGPCDCDTFDKTALAIEAAAARAEAERLRGAVDFLWESQHQYHGRTPKESCRYDWCEKVRAALGGAS